MSALVQDLHYALRQLRKSPAFAISAVLTLAMAIGANVVVFSVLYGLVLRPLNVPQPETLYSLQHTIHKDYNDSYPDYLDLRDRNHSFENLVAYTVTQVGLDTGKDPTPTWGLETSGNYFDSLRIQPYLGRFFHASNENGPNSAPYMVLGYAYWHSHFHDDREVLGRVVQVNKHPFTIIGVTPPRFRGTLVILSPDFFVPIVDCGQVEGTDYLNDRANLSVMQIMGHLKAGVTSAQATTDLNSIAADLEKTYPKDDGQGSFSLARPTFLAIRLADRLLLS